MIVNLEDLDSTNKTSLIQILHVDDDALVLEITKQILTDMNEPFEIDCALCVDEAFNKLEQNEYDVIVSDFEMPQKNGLDFLKELRERNFRLPFILFTGRGREEVAIKALNLGADGYFNKQGSPETVYGELSHGIRMVAQRKKAESVLAETQILMDAIINGTQDMIWSVRADDFRLLTFNKSLSDYFLRTQNLHLRKGLSTKEIMPTEELVERWIKLNKRALKEGSFLFEYTTLKEPRVLELRFNVLKNGEKPFAIAVFGRDITDRKNAELELKKSEERLRQVVEKHDSV